MERTGKEGVFALIVILAIVGIAFWGISWQMKNDKITEVSTTAYGTVIGLQDDQNGTTVILSDGNTVHVSPKTTLILGREYEFTTTEKRHSIFNGENSSNTAIRLLQGDYRWK